MSMLQQPVTNSPQANAVILRVTYTLLGAALGALAMASHFAGLAS